MPLNILFLRADVQELASGKTLSLPYKLIQQPLRLHHIHYCQNQFFCFLCRHRCKRSVLVAGFSQFELVNADIKSKAYIGSIFCAGATKHKLPTAHTPLGTTLEGDDGLTNKSYDILIVKHSILIYRTFQQAFYFISTLLMHLQRSII